MSTFDEIVASLRANAGADADLSPYDDLTASYMGLTENAAASAAEKDAAIAERDGIINQLKAQNFDLLMQISAQSAPADEPHDDEHDDEPDDEDAGEDDVDDLFD